MDLCESFVPSYRRARSEHSVEADSHPGIECQANQGAENDSTSDPAEYEVGVEGTLTKRLYGRVGNV